MIVDKTELHLAFIWTCDECGRDNFERGITLSKESIKEQTREKFEVFGGDGVYMMAPITVTCGHCDTEFETIEP